jgi:hypothetical protein
MMNGRVYVRLNSVPHTRIVGILNLARIVASALTDNRGRREDSSGDLCG